MKLVYFDQPYYGQLLRPANRGLCNMLRGLVDAGHIACPVSMAHLVETLKTPRPDTRANLGELMVRLSGGKAVSGQNILWGLEWRAYVDGHRADWVREHMLNDGESLLPLLASLGHLDLDSTAPHLASQVDLTLGRAAAQSNEMQLGWASARDQAVENLGDASVEAPETRDDFFRAFPSLAIRVALEEAARKHTKGGVNGNDLIDFSAVGWVLTYFDLIAVDKATGARVEDASAAGNLPLGMAVVVRFLRELRGGLEQVIGGVEQEDV